MAKRLQTLVQGFSLRQLRDLGVAVGHVSLRTGNTRAAFKTPKGLTSAPSDVGDHSAKLVLQQQGSNNATVQVKDAESHSITSVGRSCAGWTESRPEGIACFADAVCGRLRGSDARAVRACCITCALAVPMRSAGASMQHAARGAGAVMQLVQCLHQHVGRQGMGRRA